MDDAAARANGTDEPRVVRQLPQLPQVLDGFAESYTVSGCANPAHCGLFRRTLAHCDADQTDRWGCPGGEFAQGNTDSTLCDGAPVYQLMEQGGGGDGPVLWRSYDGLNTRWNVGSSDALASCGDGELYLRSAAGYAEPAVVDGVPSATVYSGFDGQLWLDFDVDPSAHGTITVSVCDGCGF